MKLEVGMYVRTKKGLIAKYIKINNKYEWHVFDNKIQWFYEYYRNEIDFDSWEDFIKEKVVKASHNIIDLIEVGDYVNGEEVESFEMPPDYEEEELGFPIYDEDSDYFHRTIIGYTPLKQVEIKSIATREQFEGLMYKVGE